MNLIDKKNLINSAFLLILLIGISVFLGWIFDVQCLKTTFLSNYTLKINSSICLVLICICYLLIFNNKKYKIIKYFGLLLILFALLTISQNIFNYNLGIDEFIVLDQENILRKLPFPGRPSPMISFCLLLFGISIFGIINEKIQLKKIAQYALHIVSTVSFVAIMGYLFKVPQFYKLLFLNSMPPNGAYSFYFLSIIATFHNQDLGITGLFSGSKIGSVMARSLFPKVLISVIFVSYIIILLHEKQMVTFQFGIALFALSFILITFYFIGLTAKTLNKIEFKKQIADLKLIQLNQNLESIIEKRTNELRKINVKLEKNEEYLKNLFNNNSVAVVVYSIEEKSQKYLEVNDGFEEIVGYKKHEVIGKNAIDLKIIADEDYNSVMDLLKEQGYLRNVQITLITKTGKKITVLCSINNFKKDNINCILCSFINISNRIEEELKLKKLSEYLTRQNKQLESFSFIVSHNLRGSTSNLISLLDFYKDQNNKEGQEFIMNKVDQTVNNLSVTLNNLLEVISIRSNGNLKTEVVFFEEVFLKLIQTYQGEIMKYDANVLHDFEKAQKIDYFAPYLESIMQNLLSNALKYSNPKTKPIVKFETYIQDNSVFMKVSDNGLGIDLARNGKQLFGFNKIFHKHPDAKGVGLFITKEQIESLGGEISAESLVGKGTTFTIILNNNNLNT